MKITSKTQISATVSTKTHLDSFAIVRLDGRIDWIVVQRNALVAWTGPMLSPRPKIMGSHVGPPSMVLLMYIVSILGLHQTHWPWGCCIIRKRVYPRSPTRAG